MTHWNVREQRRRYAFFTATRHRQTLLASCAAIDERPQERKIVREIFQYAFQITFQAS